MRSIFNLTALSCFCFAVAAQEGHYKSYKVSADFHEVANKAAFFRIVDLSPDALRKLQKNLFVVTPGSYEQMDPIYSDSNYRDVPDLVTVDWTLHIYHVFYDALLRSLESKSLSKIAVRLSVKMLDRSLAQWKASNDPVERAAALKNVAYFMVAVELFDGKMPKGLPQEAAALAKKEQSLVGSAQGPDESSVFGGNVDYSQFIVRGHYTKSKVLQHYFRGITWLSLPFSLNNLDGSPNENAIRQSALMSAAEISCAADWNRIYEPTKLFVGPSNGYTPGQVREAVAKAGKNSAHFYEDVLAQLSAFQMSVIVSSKGNTGLKPAMQFSFLGKRFIPDSMVLQNLTCDARPLPSGLDIMAVLGSQEAASILDGHPALYNAMKWSGYLPAREALAKRFADYPAGYWTSNLYWGWLNILRGYLVPALLGSPSFMLTKAWEDKKLTTASGSWTELRHDTILYGQQSASEGDEDDTVPPYVPEFVEPVPETFRRISTLLRQTQNALRKMGLLEAQVSQNISDFMVSVDFLAKAAAEELAGQRLSMAENTHVRDIEGSLADSTTQMILYGLNAQDVTEDDLDMALVADVHTAGDVALEEAVGHPDDVIAIVPINGKLYFARGAVFSYYEFTAPISERLSDPQWKAEVADGKTPSRPGWTSSYLSPIAAKDKN